MNKYESLNTNDVIKSGDEILKDDCETWIKVDDCSSWAIGGYHNKERHRPMRRKTT